MLKRLLLVALLALLLKDLSAQTEMDTLHYRKIYAVSGLGWGFSLGETSDVLQPKFSNNLGLDISLVNRHYFIYPSIDFLTFEYDQKEVDPAYNHMLEKGRSNLYILNLAGGVRKQFNKLNVYAFAGPGVGLLSEPRAEVKTVPSKVTINTEYYLTPSVRGGIG